MRGVGVLVELVEAGVLLPFVFRGSWENRDTTEA